MDRISFKTLKNSKLRGVLIILFEDKINKHSKKNHKEMMMIKNLTPKFKKISEYCDGCKSQNVKYWDETDEEIIFKCLDCNRFITIPFKNDKLRFYFSF